MPTHQGIKLKLFKLRRRVPFDRLQEIASLQKEYYELFHGHNGKACSKQAIVRLVLPFRDKYKLTDREALDIARSVMPNWRIANLLEYEDENENGKWERDGRFGFACSVCGATSEDLTPYCAECGAKMQR